MVNALRLALCLLLMSFVCSRAEITAEASISANQVSVSEPFQITVQITSEEKPENLPWPSVEGLDKFTVTKNTGTSRSSQTTIVNGRISSRNLFITQFVFTLTAQKTGTFAVGPIRYAYKTFDKTLGSANVTVSKQEAGLTSEGTLNKHTAYVGEQTFFNLRIIPTQGAQNINITQDLQKLIGEKFWFQRLDKTVEPKILTLNGQSVRVFDIRIVLFPLLAGKAELSGIPVQYQQVQRSQRRRQGSVFDMFDDDVFGGGASVINMTATTSPTSMEVIPLPSGTPADFTGAVGNYSLTAVIDKTTVPSGDACTLTITIQGNGQPKSITKPRLPDLSQFEIFDPEENTTSNTQGNILVTTKIFKYVIVPQRKGEAMVGPIIFPYFDPVHKIYAEAKSQPISLAVTQGKELTASQGRVMTQREITDIGSDIRHIKVASTPLQNEDDFLYRRAWFWLLFLPSPLAFTLLLAVRRRSRLLATDATLKRKTQASAQLKRRLKEANEALKQKNAKEFYKALSQAVVGFASDKLNVEFRGLTMEDSKAKLVESGLPITSSAEYEKLLTLCDFGQFSGAQRDDKAWKEALDGAEALLRKMDREL